jgi:tellurite resistance protein TehA-like permease
LELPDARVVNGGWFIPPVVTIIVPVVLVPLLSQVGPSAARLLLFTGYAFWGVGFLLFLLVMGLLHDRLVTRALPAAAMAPSLWIVLGPLGVGAAGLLDLGRAAPTVLGPGAAVIGTLSLVGASALWGFGAWSLLVAMSLLGLWVPRMPSVACDQHFDALPRARRASGRDPLVPLPSVLPRPPADPTHLPP